MSKKSNNTKQKPIIKNTNTHIHARTHTHTHTARNNNPTRNFNIIPSHNPNLKWITRPWPLVQPKKRTSAMSACTSGRAHGAIGVRDRVRFRFRVRVRVRVRFRVRVRVRVRVGIGWGSGEGGRIDLSVHSSTAFLSSKTDSGDHSMSILSVVG